MKITLKKLFIFLIIALLIIGGIAFLFGGGDLRNKMSRSGVALKSDDYRITVNMGNESKIYEMRGKVTSSPKGYYFFWYKTDQGKFYVQTPIALTVVEEM